MAMRMYVLLFYCTVTLVTSRLKACRSSPPRRLKTVSLVVENSQRADALVKVFESKLYEEDAVNCDLKSIETVISTLKV